MYARVKTAQKQSICIFSPHQCRDIFIYLHILHLMSAVHFKQVGAGGKKDWKLWNDPKTPVCNIPQVNRFIDSRWMGCPQKAQSFTTLWNTLLYTGYYYMGSGTLVKQLVCKSMGFCFSFSCACVFILYTASQHLCNLCPLHLKGSCVHSFTYLVIMERFRPFRGCFAIYKVKKGFVRVYFFILLSWGHKLKQHYVGIGILCDLALS